jgi:cytochrome c-type biogenesis protein CcmH
MRRLAAIALVLAAIASSSSLAVQPEEMLRDPKLEARAREAVARVTLHGLPKSINRRVRSAACARSAAAGPRTDHQGDTDQQVLDFLVVRYGEFVLLKPPLESRTIILWALPPVALLAGAVGLFFAVRRRRTVQLEPATLSNEEQRKLSTLVDEHRAER